MLVFLPVYLLGREHDIGDALLVPCGEEALHSVLGVVLGSNLLLEYLEVASIAQGIAC